MRVFGITGFKNSGKTGLMERLVADITARGFVVSTLKHAHHNTDIDHPGRDSHRHREAGATEVLLSSPRRWALMHELRNDDEPPIAELISKLGPADLVLIEGYKRDVHPKIEAFRAETGRPPLYPDNNTIKALASDTQHPTSALPVFDLNATELIADFILSEVGLISSNDTKPSSELTPPRLRDDCFAMPQGVDWIPVETALARLQEVLSPVTDVQTCAVDQAQGRVLAEDQYARRANPPRANSAVDGYGFDHVVTGDGKQTLPLVQGRSAAGQPYDGAVPKGHAVRILTGAILPAGVNTVVLEEDTATDGNVVVFDGPAKPSANTRNAGEDVDAGECALPKGHVLRAPDLALLSALGVASAQVYRPLRVGVLSTGDEIISSPSDPALPHQIWDANRPMLLNLASKWSYAAVDLGHAMDNPDDIAARLDDARHLADVVVTSGGASAGDEDHVSALLRDRGSLSSWRIALKPGRPLALATWDGMPVFGLPGNPVAALICALIFCKPAFSKMSGAGWHKPQGFSVPAAFTKNKKAGRREFLRARLTETGAAEVFASEGSGRISGLSWATGLVELPDDAMVVSYGTPVRYIPYASFGL